MAYQINEVSEGSIVGAYNALTAAPTTGTYRQGDFIRNSAPVVNAFTTSAIFGWLCTVSGTPGTWVACSFLSDIPTATAWTAPTLLNSWTNTGGAFSPTGYRKSAGNIVHLRGKLTAGTLTDGTALFTLPSGYRPAYTEAFRVTSDKGGVDVNILADGNVKIYYAAAGAGSGNGPGGSSGGAGAATTIGIDGITFTSV